MATLAPPPAPGKTPRPPAKKTAGDPHWSQRLTRSGFFLAAVLFHLILFMLVATWVVFRPVVPPSDEFVKTYVPPSAPPPPPPPPTETIKVPTQAISTPQNIIINNSATTPTFSVPLPDLTTTTTMTQPTAKPMAVTTPNNLPKRLPTIKSMETTKWGRSINNILETNGDVHAVVATFPIYVASYEGGDWQCNLQVVNGQIVAGSMPDLVQKVVEWSHGNLKGRVEPTPLVIGGPELASKQPPFIFFTGHKDFQLTPQEVENLRNYLQDGGCIWGDNALAGSGSRFDIAFRREMKKVLPDIDKNFQEVPITSEIFTKSWFPLDKLPQGMNYYAEPLQHIDIDGKLAVLYTPNDYSDMLFMHILPGDTQVSLLWATNKDPLFTNQLFFNNSQIFFRNFTLPSCLGAYRLGMDIVAHLLVRFDKDLMLAP